MRNVRIIDDLSLEPPDFPEGFVGALHAAFKLLGSLAFHKERNRRVRVALFEEIAFRRGYITREELIALAQPLLKTEYGQYLVEIAEGL